MGWMPVPLSWPSSMHVCPLATLLPLQHYDQGTRSTMPSTGKVGVGVAYYMYAWVWLITCMRGCGLLHVHLGVDVNPLLLLYLHK